MFKRQIIFLDSLLLHFLSPVLRLRDVVAHGEYAVVEFLDGVVDLDDVLVTDEAVLVGDELVDLDKLAWVIGVQEEEELVAQLAVGAGRFVFGEAVEVLHQVFAGFHLVTRYNV